MATKSGDMKGFYRQRKATGAITKPSPKTSKKKSSSSAQPTALISHASLDLIDDLDKHEEELRKFDMNIAYGPCAGMSRLARWERAQRVGLNPPKEIEGLLKGQKVQSECLWDGRI